MSKSPEQKKRDYATRERYRARNREKAAAWERRYRIKRLYGITLEKFDAMMAEQQGRCKICDKDITTKGKAVIDHCHATKAVRGLLCRECNLVIGHAFDDPTILTRAASYLEGK